MFIHILLVLYYPTRSLLVGRLKFWRAGPKIFSPTNYLVLTRNQRKGPEPRRSVQLGHQNPQFLAREVQKIFLDKFSPFHWELLKRARTTSIGAVGASESGDFCARGPKNFFLTNFLLFTRNYRNGPEPRRSMQLGYPSPGFLARADQNFFLRQNFSFLPGTRETVSRTRYIGAYSESAPLVHHVRDQNLP